MKRGGGLKARAVARSLRPVDALTISFLVILSLLILVGARSGEGTSALLLLNLLAVFLIVLLAVGARKFAIVRFLHDWFPIPAIFFVFKEIHTINRLLGGSDWDELLIRCDFAIFGVHPTQWLGQFSSPIITEILEISYASYYFILLAVGVELFLRNERRNFSYT